MAGDELFGELPEQAKPQADAPPRERRACVSRNATRSNCARWISRA